jgi:hypothetical protein
VNLSAVTNRRIVNSFLLFHLVLMVSWSLPVNSLLVAAVKGAMAPYAWKMGLFQDWSMFAPHPPHDNTYINAEITYSDGQIRVWEFPQMQDLGYIDRYFKERYRKWSNERLRVEENSVLWPDAARYIARLNSNEFNPPRLVKLIRYWSPIPPMGQPPQPEHWQRQVYFTYAVKSGDLL